MALSAELAEAVAEVLGAPSSEAITHLRNLRKAGLISKAGRGAYGAAMTESDAIPLLLAMTGAERVKDSVKAAEALAALPLRKHGMTWRRKEWNTGSPLLALDPEPTLNDAMHCLLGVTALQLGLGSSDRHALSSMINEARRPPRFEIRISYPDYGAVIIVTMPGVAEERWTFGRDKETAGGGDHQRQSKFTEVTLQKVCTVLAAR